MTKEPQLPSQEHQSFVSDSMEDLKALVNNNLQGAFLCTSLKADNPNYLAIIHANEIFSKSFNISQEDLIGKSYDFLFDNIDINYSSEDQLEYIRLIKTIKDLHECSVVMKLNHHHENEQQIAKFKINFKPIFQKSDTSHKKFYAIFTFEKIDGEAIAVEENKSQNQLLVKNLERALNSEKLLREISYLIISDKPVKEIAQSVAKSLVQHLKIDRCIIHDYKNGVPNFIIEYCSSRLPPMLDDSKESYQKATRYINFQNIFYQKIKIRDKNSAIFIADDVRSDPSFSSFQNFFNEFSITSQIAAITSFDGVINGGIYLFQSEKRSWTIDAIELIELVTDQLAIAIDRSYSIEKVMIANHNLLSKTLELKEAVKKEKALRKVQSEFVALVSHEFKTPLQIIDSTRELIARKLKLINPSDDSFDKYLDRIKSGIQRMGGLISSTLNLAKIETANAEIKVERQNFDINHLINDIIAKTSNLCINKNIKITTKFDGEKLEINGDAKLLEHCFTNIISNAIKYSPNNTAVTIITKSDDEKIAIRVTDNGIGIPQDDLSNIGNKFFRAKNTLSVSGTGIGLYLTKYFIELHRGSVLIKSKLNIGTSVTVILPRNLN